ncbi:MAG: 50S ribosomal protein L27 [Candidatus Spechtbacteria bacterium]|nr:50S ribosomal protein L27 [Candidatus Spechtbacteria bacterium]
MSKTKAAGTTRLGRDSHSQRLGVKLFAGQDVKAGNIIVRQRGSHFIAGDNVRSGKDDTLYAARNGKISFTTVRKRRFNGQQRVAKVVHVL